MEIADTEGVWLSSCPGVNKSAKPPGERVDRALADLAGRQHGRVTLWQVVDLGLTRSAVTRRVASGRLHRTRRGVYAVGHRAPTRASAYMEAVLACGPGAVLSHRSAADHHGLRPSARARVDVTVPDRRGYLPGIDAHCSRTLHPADVMTVDGIPCTTVARTLLDLAEVVDRLGVERVIERAEQLRAFDGRQVEAVLARASGRRGAPVVQAILADYEEPPLTKSELERLFFGLCDRAGMDRPQTQAEFVLPDGDTVYADFFWADAKLIVETDGRETHNTPQAFERDRRRDRQLTMLGYRVVRFTWRDLQRRPDEVVRTLAALRG